MPYIHRNEKGKISAVSYDDESAKDDSYWEWMKSDDKEFCHFIATLNAQNPLKASDLDFVRVVEDLVELLIQKNYIHFTDLPEIAQQKFRQRKSLRGKLNTQLDLLDDDDSDGLL